MPYVFNKRWLLIIFGKIPKKRVLGSGFERELHLLAFLRPDLKDDLNSLINKISFLNEVAENKSLAEKLAEPFIQKIFHRHQLNCINNHKVIS